MPELPEVETVRRALQLHAAGREVVAVRGRKVAMRRELRPLEIAAGLVGRRLAAPRRRGKYLLLDVTAGGSLLVHLGMSGRLRLGPMDEPERPHTHLAVLLEGGLELRLEDPRRFGLAVWLPPGAEADEPALNALGLEPLRDDLPRLLPPLLRRHRSPIKAVLLNQRVLAGVGNIYATEALWRAGIHPRRFATAIAMGRLERLAEAVRSVLEEAVAAGGTTLRDYVAPSGEPGFFRLALAAYGRAGLPCTRCGRPLAGGIVAGRGTAWCPACQR